MKCPKCGYLGFETTDRCRNCQYDFSLTPFAADPELTLFFAADRTPPAGRNINYVNDDLLTRLVYAADRTIDREERKKHLREAQIRIADLAVEIPLYNVTKLDAVPASLQGFKGNPTNAGAFWNVHEWELKP